MVAADQWMPRGTSMEWTAQFRKVAPRQSRKPSGGPVGTSRGEAFPRQNRHSGLPASHKVRCCFCNRTED